MSKWTLSSHHPKGYGNYDRVPPDPAKCAAEVSDGERFPSYYQCSRKRGHGPEQAFCKQHSPEAVAAPAWT